MIRKCCVVERPSRARPFSRCVSWCGLGKLEASHSYLAAWFDVQDKGVGSPPCWDIKPTRVPRGTNVFQSCSHRGCMRGLWILETQELFL